MKTIYLPLPPRDEQDQIVRFLDWKVSQINRLINAKRRQIVLLDEQKQVIINNSVTKQGKGWQEVALGNLGVFRKGFGGSRSDDVENGSACIRYGDIYRSGERVLSQPITRIATQITGSYARVFKSEMLFALSGETKEEIGQALVNNIGEDTWCGGDTAIFTASDIVLPMFLAYAVRCPYIVQQRASMAKGDIIVHISTGALKRIRVFVPLVDEQREIVEYLNAQCANIDGLISRLNYEIALFSEYRVRLIFDVVTGKVDVREVIIPKYVAVEEVVEDNKEFDEFEITEEVIDA